MRRFLPLAAVLLTVAGCSQPQEGDPAAHAPGKIPDTYAPDALGSQPNAPTGTKITPAPTKP